MKGLELAKRLYEERARKLFENELPDLIPQMAVGLVGEGSECFGFDDEISRDHDWGRPSASGSRRRSWPRTAAVWTVSWRSSRGSLKVSRSA